MGRHSIDVGRLLANLVDLNMLIVERRGRWTTYQINAEYEKQPEQMELVDALIPKVDLNKTDQFDIVNITLHFFLKDGNSSALP